MQFREHRSKVEAKAHLLLGLAPIFIDTETTGFESSDVVVEVAVLDSDGTVLFESLVNPHRPIPAQATAVHGITDEMVSSAPGWEQLWPEFEKAVKGRVAGFYNAEFDLRLLKQSCAYYDIHWNYPFEDDFCVMELFAQYYGDWDTRRNKYRWQNLATAGRFFNIPEKNQHRAKDDALLTKFVLEKMVEGIRQ